MIENAHHLKVIEQRLLWLSHWMIHNANHIRPKADGIKVGGHRTVPLGVEHFGQTGTIGDLYRHFGIDAQGILEKVAGLTVGKPLSPQVL